MAGKQAKILSDDQVERLLSFVSTSRNPIRNRVLVLLSLKAGLRAGEIANLTWPMVLDPSGDIGPVIEVRDHAAKKKSGRLRHVCGLDVLVLFRSTWLSGYRRLKKTQIDSSPI
jgi:integrase/recombinase XerD